MHEITTIHWLWVVGMGLVTLIILFLAAESIIRGKLQAPSFILAGFLIILAAFTMSLFISCISDFQNDRLDTFRAMHREWKQVSGYLGIG